MKRYFLYYEKLSEWKDAEEAFINIYGKKKYIFWLDSSRAEEGLSRFSYMGEAKKIINYSLKNLKSSKSTDIFSDLNQQLQKVKINKTNLPFDFTGGFVGYFGYELKVLCGFNNAHKSEYPDSLWYFIDQFLVFDHEAKEIYAVCLTEQINNAKAWCRKIKSKIQAISALPKVCRQKTKQLKFCSVRDKEQYIKDINLCKEYLKKGESYEICLTNTITVEVSINSLDLYRVLRKLNPAPYAAYIKHGAFAVLCSSPERFLKVDQNRWIESKPIKGTAKRGITQEEDIKLAEQLRIDEKTRAENLMIVDLVRNDLGKVCEPGSIFVSKLMEIETYETVHQLVSTICGKQKKDVSVIDCIKSCFPGGSMTGAPKKRTLEILDKLEKKARGVYSGALGFLSANGTADLNIVIRTILVNKNKLSVGAGGAIVAQSDAKKEFEEMILKAQVLIQAITA